MELNYSLYGSGMLRPTTHQELIALNTEEPGLLLARAENSGSEGCYVEVARWSFKRTRWERYCFHKFFDGDVEGKTAIQLCQEMAAEINRGSEQSRFIHALPDFNSR